MPPARQSPNRRTGRSAGRSCGGIGRSSSVFFPLPKLRWHRSFSHGRSCPLSRGKESAIKLRTECAPTQCCSRQRARKANSLALSCFTRPIQTTTPAWPAWKGRRNRSGIRRCNSSSAVTSSWRRGVSSIPNCRQATRKRPRAFTSPTCGGCASGIPRGVASPA